MCRMTKAPAGTYNCRSGMPDKHTRVALSDLRRQSINLGLGVFAATALSSPAQAGVDVEGVSGLLSVPTAEVVQDGEAVFSVGRILTDNLGGEEANIARLYNATVGYLPGLEITARFIDYPGRPDPNMATNYSDRSVAVKYQFYKVNDWSLAAGATDIGGYSKANRAYYGVVDYSGVPNLVVSAGAGTDKYEGVFGGLRWTPTKYVSLVGEYDTEQANYGLELHPRDDISLMCGIANDHVALSASYSFPLDPRGKDTLCTPACVTRGECEYADPCSQAAAVRDALVAADFENVLVGTGGGVLSIEFENRRYQNQIDAIGVTAATALRLAGVDIERVVITPKLDDVPQLSLQAGLSDLADFLVDPGTGDCGIHVASYLPGGCPADMVYAPEGNKKPGAGEINLRLIEAFEITSPGQPTFASSTGLGLEEKLFLGRGLHLRARQDWPLHNDLTDKTDPVNRDAYLQYLDAWSPGLFVLGSAGYYGDETFGGTFEAGYYLDGTDFKLGGRGAWFTDESTGAADTEDSQLLGTATYFVRDLDWELTALGGRFEQGDQGTQIESTRYFGPSSLTFFAYDTDATRAHGGFRLNIPLPWFNEGHQGAWRLNGAPDFGYQYRTDSGQFGRVARADYNIEAVRGQLRPEYVAEHLADLRRAVLLHTCGCDG